MTSSAISLWRERGCDLQNFYGHIRLTSPCGEVIPSQVVASSSTPRECHRDRG